MAISERQLHEQHQAMISDLAARHTRLKQLGPDDAAFGERYEQLTAGAAQLLEFERAMRCRRVWRSRNDNAVSRS